MYIFVYGTLKKREINNRLLNGSEFICKTKTVEKYTMLDFGPFPGVLKYNGKLKLPLSRIKGEIYDITHQTLEGIDILEGEWYFREEVEFEGGIKAQMYFLEKIPPVNYTLIPEGNWAGK